jgi:hypothetical protein
MGLVTREMAIHDPSGHSSVVVVEVVVPIVRMEKLVNVVVIVLNIGLVATAVEAA